MKEIINSLISCLIFGVFTSSVFVAKNNGYTNIYDDISEYGWAYFFLSIPLMLVIHDTYFYFAHRLMHHPKLFKTFHFEHHKSLNPNAFSSYSFDIGEAVVQVLGTSIMISILPVHAFAIVIFYFIAFMLNIVGHISYEMYPDNYIVRKIVTTPTHHHLHHHAGATNFSLYLTFWDKFFGTLHKDYYKIFDEVISNNRKEVKEFSETLRTIQRSN